MPLYAESSAVLLWLLGQERAGEVAELIDSADWIFASDLTLIEVDRAIIRAQALGQVPPTRSADLADLLAETSSTWDIVGFTPGIIRRARKSFPVEPIRALDAIHLASALAVCDTVDDLAILTFDDRIRRVAQAMGLGVTP